MSGGPPQRSTKWAWRMRLGHQLRIVARQSGCQLLLATEEERREGTVSRALARRQASGGNALYVPDKAAD